MYIYIHVYTYYIFIYIYIPTTNAHKRETACCPDQASELAASCMSTG